MSELPEQLSRILSDPAGMEQIRALAANLLGTENADSTPALAEKNGQSATTDIPGNIDLARLLPLISSLSAADNSPRGALLKALRPHLSAARQERLDRAITILKIYDLLPAIKQSGILGSLGL